MPLSALTLLLAVGFAQEPAEAVGQADRIGAALARCHERLVQLQAERGFPGVTFAVSLPDGTVTETAAGFADVEAEIVMGPRSRMLAGSVGKTFVAAVTLQLAGEGKLSLDAPISKWLGEEEWFEKLPNARNIRVRHLLNHTSGLAEHVRMPEFHAAMLADRDKVWTPEERIAFLFGKPALFEVGDGWSYADTNYIVLGMILEKVAGEPFYEQARKRLLDPLELTLTSPSDRRRMPDLVPGYLGALSRSMGIEDEKTVQDGLFFVNPQLEWTGGGFASNAGDLARWMRALVDGDVVPASLREDFLTEEAANTAPGDRYGLGVQIYDSEIGMAIGHGGWFPGYLTECCFFPEPGFAAAIQFNTDEFSQTGWPRTTLLELAKIVAEAVSAG